jgi:hypothetical protein
MDPVIIDGSSPISCKGFMEMGKGTTDFTPYSGPAIGTMNRSILPCQSNRGRKLQLISIDAVESELPQFCGKSVNVRDKKRERIIKTGSHGWRGRQNSTRGASFMTEKTAK